MYFTDDSYSVLVWGCTTPYLLISCLRTGKKFKYNSTVSRKVRKRWTFPCLYFPVKLEGGQWWRDTIGELEGERRGFHEGSFLLHCNTTSFKPGPAAVIRDHFSSLSWRHPDALFFALMTSSGLTFLRSHDVIRTHFSCFHDVIQDHVSSLSWRHPDPLFFALLTSSGPTFLGSHDVIWAHFSSLSCRHPGPLFFVLVTSSAFFRSRVVIRTHFSSLHPGDVM